jgi:hypothetical protein
MNPAQSKLPGEIQTLPSKIEMKFDAVFNELQLFL